MQMYPVFKKTIADAHAAGARDSRHFMAMYRAYLRGASEAAGMQHDSEQAHGFGLTVAAMAFALLGWIVTMYFVFK